VYLGHLEDGNVVVDFCAVFLGDTLCDPDDVAALLLLQLQIRVEHTKVELLHECHHVQTHLIGGRKYQQMPDFTLDETNLMLKEFVF
jgi:hypothetical protein